MQSHVVERVALSLSPEDGGAAPPSNWEGHEEVSWAALLLPKLGDTVFHFLPSAGEGGFDFGQVPVGEVVEFAADQEVRGPRGGKKKIQRRWHGVVREKTAAVVVMDRYESREAAFLETERARQRRNGTGLPYATLVRQLEDLRQKQAELEALIQETEAHLGLVHLMADDELVVPLDERHGW